MPFFPSLLRARIKIDCKILSASLLLSPLNFSFLHWSASLWRLHIISSRSCFLFPDWLVPCPVGFQNGNVVFWDLWSAKIVQVQNLFWYNQNEINISSGSINGAAPLCGLARIKDNSFDCSICLTAPFDSFDCAIFSVRLTRLTKPLQNLLPRFVWLHRN